MANIIAICNQKGGVGKTVTTVNLGIGLARQGKRVLLVDVDAQGSLTASLGYQHPDQLDKPLATVLGKVIEDEPLLPSEGILHHEEGVDLLPANIDLAAMEVTLVNIMSRETILREYLNTVRNQYDIILLDCCPSLGMLTINALSAADTVIIPMMAHYLSLKGMEQLMRTIGRVKRQINPEWVQIPVMDESTSVQILKAENEVARTLDTLDYDKNALRKKMMECAALKYVDIDSAPYIAHRLKATLADAEPLSAFSLALFKRTVQAIRLEKDGTVAITLLNDQTIRKDDEYATDSEYSAEGSAEDTGKNQHS